MNDETSKENDKQPDPNPNPNRRGDEEFARAIARIAVAQVCENEGFHGFQHSALESLSDVAIRYIRQLGKFATCSANLAARSECNVFDIVLGLQDLGSIQGFSGNSDVKRSVLDSGVVREIKQYMNFYDETPFPYTLPRFSVERQCTGWGSRVGNEHVPNWLPAFPSGGDSVELGGGRDGNELEDKVVQKEDLGLGNNGSLAVIGFERGESSKVKKSGEINPFLAPPLSYGEIEVGCIGYSPRFLDGMHVVNHHGNGMMMMDRFGIVDEQGSKMVCENPDGEKEKEKEECVCSDGRPLMKLKFNSVRKSLPTSRNVIARISGDEKLATYFGSDEDDEKDKMKQRAEQVFKEPMDNQFIESSSVVN